MKTDLIPKPLTRYNMRTAKRFSIPVARGARFLGRARLFLVLALSVPVLMSAADIGKTFTSPEEAVSALLAATSANDTNAFREIFGPTGVQIENPDRVQSANEVSAFDSAAKEQYRIVHQSEANCVLEVGNNAWPFPVPIVKRNGVWFFDTKAGKEEILNRHIGKNELSTLDSVRAYVEAQREYASKDRVGDEVLEYAQKFNSSPGKKDGLYWPPELDGEISPLGPLLAQAQHQDYESSLVRNQAERAAPQPFHGYFYKILYGQGKHAPAGKYDYIINGHMIAGFALVAWPVKYGETGVMTFIVNQQGRVYQKDLGPKTAKIVGTMKAYDPDTTWTISPD